MGTTQSVLSDDEGAFLLRDVAGGVQTLRGSVDDDDDEVFDRIGVVGIRQRGVDLAGVNIRLEDAVVVRGQVLDAQNVGVAGVDVLLSRELQLDDGSVVEGAVEAQALSNKAGQFEISPVAPGVVTLKAQSLEQTSEPQSAPTDTLFELRFDGGGEGEGECPLGTVEDSIVIDSDSDPEFLRGISCIDGVLTFEGVASLEGAENLQRVGGLRVVNSSIEDLDELSSLHTIQGDLALENLPALRTTLTLGLLRNPPNGNLRFIDLGQFYINIAEPALPPTVQSVHIENTFIIGATALRSVSAVEGDLTLRNNEEFLRPTDLAELQSVGGVITLDNTGFDEAEEEELRARVQ